MACILWCRNRSITSATTCISAQGAPAVLVGLLLLMNLFLSDMLTGQRKGEGRGVSLLCPYSGLPHPFFPLSSAPCFFTKKNIEESLPQKKKRASAKHEVHSLFLSLMFITTIISFLPVLLFKLVAVLFSFFLYVSRSWPQGYRWFTQTHPLHCSLISFFSCVFVVLLYSLVMVTKPRRAWLV
jgi:hypothetical protein